jgi:uncharacterized repeat protein (TIGR03806 family)
MRRALLALAFLAAGCGAEAVTPAYFPAENPERLSDWGAVAVRGGALTLGEGVTPYALNTPLFTDYAHKLRTVWSPRGPAPYGEGAALDLPVGTVITKTFYYPTDGEVVLKAKDAEETDRGRPLPLAGHRLIETRLLVRRGEGWVPLSYVWNEAQTEATLRRTGAVVRLAMLDEAGADPFSARGFAYVVPNENQCAGCHAPDATSKAIVPLGPRPEQLNRDYAYADGARNQLIAWADRGLVAEAPSEASAWAPWDGDAALGARARSYLAANCAHCHNPVGPADTSGLDLSAGEVAPQALGVCKPPIAAGSGTGGHRFGIVPGHADQSILTYRVGSDDPGAMMPELGRSLVHEEGLALLEEWIDGMGGACS